MLTLTRAVPVKSPKAEPLIVADQVVERHQYLLSPVIVVTDKYIATLY